MNVSIPMDSHAEFPINPTLIYLREKRFEGFKREKGIHNARIDSMGVSLRGTFTCIIVLKFYLKWIIKTFLYNFFIIIY